MNRRELLIGAAAALLLPSRARAATVKTRIRATPAMEGQGAIVQRVFPSAQLRHLDPFVLLDDFDVIPPAGFPTHPHRGFEAFTYMIEGAFHHQDNLGNDSLVHAGGVQRFCSGRGAFHSEMPGPATHNRGLQLWVNLPRRLKTMAPEYQAVQQLPRDRNLREIVGYKSPADLKTEVQYYDVTLDGNWRREIAKGWNTLVYVIAGSLEVAGETLARGDGVVLGDGKLLVRGAGRFVFLSGVPHDEPILLRGPFVD